MSLCIIKKSALIKLLNRAERRFYGCTTIFFNKVQVKIYSGIWQFRHDASDIEANFLSLDENQP